MCSVALRIELEKRIVRKVLADARARGYSFACYDEDGGEYGPKLTNIPKAIAEIFNLDDVWVRFRTSSGLIVGAVYFVMGNDGYDVISDYSANKATEVLLEGALAISEKYS